jgi:hypothetical protein
VPTLSRLFPRRRLARLCNSSRDLHFQMRRPSRGGGGGGGAGCGQGRSSRCTLVGCRRPTSRHDATVTRGNGGKARSTGTSPLVVAIGTKRRRWRRRAHVVGRTAAAVCKGRVCRSTKGMVKIHLVSPWTFQVQQHGRRRLTTLFRLARRRRSNIRSLPRRWRKGSRIARRRRRFMIVLLVGTSRWWFATLRRR